MEKIKAEADAVADRMKELLATERIATSEDTGAPLVAVVAQGRSLQSLKPFADQYLKVPERRKGTAVHKTLESLIKHVQSFGTKNAALFADPGDGKGKDAVILAVLNYNPATKSATDTDWCDHRSRYNVPLSEEWKAWKAIDGQAKTQREFAQFLEARIEDLGDPKTAGSIAKQIPDKLGLELATPTEILKLSKGLALRIGREVTNSYDASTGEQVLQFEEKHTDKFGGPLKTPKAFLLNIPVFLGGKVYPVGVRIVYAVEGATAFYTVHLYREDLYFKAAFDEACEKASSDTSVVLYVGSPE